MPSPTARRQNASVVEFLSDSTKRGMTTFSDVINDRSEPSSVLVGVPLNEDFHCDYIRRWIAVKEAWGLVMTITRNGITK